MLRLGLCCLFSREPIKFRNAQVTALKRLAPNVRRAKLVSLCEANAGALDAAVDYCLAHDIGAFRISSQVLPLCSHPELGYDPNELPRELVERFRDAGAKAFAGGLRLSFHPDQFVVLSSPHAHVVTASLAELEYQGCVAEWVGADTINLHGGGAYGDKPAALARFASSFARLSTRVRARLTVENDHTTYSPAELLPLCRELAIPLVYDVHHHRILGDGQSIATATESALATWSREPHFHVSSPLAGWAGPRPERHADELDPADFPLEWEGLTLTVDLEAKAKEVAVEKLAGQLAARGVSLWKRCPAP